jgi:predicted Zn-ribbon and HTH transcriptional regulator
VVRYLSSGMAGVAYKGIGERGAKEDSMLRKVEEQMEPQTVQDRTKVTSAKICTHLRLIDDVLTRGGKRTGKVRCLECGAKFDDPYHSRK